MLMRREVTGFAQASFGSPDTASHCEWGVLHKDDAMSDINPIQSASSIHFYQGVQRQRPTSGDASVTVRQPDQVEVSAAAHWVSQLKELPEVRQELVARVRSEIEQGTYETPEKLDVAVSDMAEDLV